MNLLRVAVFPFLLLVFCGCQSGGGKKRYEYPPKRLSDAKQVKGISLDGRFVILADGSTWNVDWADAPKVRRWSSGERVNVISTNRTSFPYALIRQSTGERAAARYGRKL